MESVDPELRKSLVNSKSTRKRVMTNAEAKAKLLSTAKKAVAKEEAKTPKFEVIITLLKMEIATDRTS